MVQVGGRVKQLLVGTLPALLLCLLLDFVAGGVLGAYFEKIMSYYPVLFVIIPGLMANRGNIFGAMASRLTTLLHLGEMEPRFGDENVHRNIMLSMLLSLFPVFLLWAVRVIKLKTLYLSVLAIVLVSTILSNLVMGYSTALATIVPFRKGVDPDTVAAPIVTSVGDIVTLPFLVFFLLLFEGMLPAFYLAMLLSAAIFILMIAKVKLRREDREIFKEVLEILLVTTLISAVSGGLLEHYSEAIYASILFGVVYPSIAGSTGNFGSIVGAKTSTRIHLGEVEGIMDRETMLDIAMYTSTGFLIGLLINIIGIFVVRVTLGRDAGIVWPFVVLYPLLLLTTMVVAYYLSRLFVRLGLDPDNGTVPMITTLADLMSMVFIVGIVHVL